MCYIRNWLFFVTFACIIYVGSADQYKLVDTDNGQMRGVKSTTLFKSDPYYAFKGIRYAKPPVGDLRFKAPEPIEPWKPEILNAFQYSNICFQAGILIPHPSPESEDCLTLNVFVPDNIRPDSKLAVLFFIHGGGFLEGVGDDHFYGPDFIIEKETILVTINYRLGALGFLSLNSTEYSGNMGLKDQQLALKWVHSNIHNFGGDSKRITIFGQSAGGASVNYHIFSAESRKYFKNAIVMSGSVHSPWALQATTKDHLKSAFEMAKQLGKPQKSYEDLVAFLKAAPADSFNQFCVVIPESPVKLTLSFGPVVERGDAKHPFLIDLPDEIYKSLKIHMNTMFVATSQEIMSLVPKPSAPIMKGLDSEFKIPLPFFKPMLPLDSEEHQSLAKEVRKFYFGDRVIDERTIPQIFDLMSDLNFIFGIAKSAKYLSKHSMGKTFYMLFSVDSKLNVWKNLNIFKRGETYILPGAAHADDLCYLFRCSMALSIYDEILNNKEDEHAKISLRAIEYIAKLYTNFAKYGEPSHGNDLGDEFRPIESNEMNYIDFSNDGVKARTNPHKSFEFWTNIERKVHELSEKIEIKKHEEL